MWARAIPGWITLPLLGGVTVALLALVGWVKPYLEGPDPVMSTVYRTRAVPVPVESVRWVTKLKTEKVMVPVQVIREVPKKQEEQFHLSLNDHRALVDVLEVPRSPKGGELAVTIDTDSGKIAGVFKPKPTPFIEFGGLREAGGEYDPFNRAVTAYYRQDLVRLGPVVITGRAFATASTGPAPAYGAVVGAAVRF